MPNQWRGEECKLTQPLESPNKQDPNLGSYQNIMNATYDNKNQLNLLVEEIPKMMERAAKDAMQGLVDLVDRLS